MDMLPKGFRLGAAAADFRNKRNGRLDLALAVSDRPAVAAGAFTTNIFKAAPVLVCQESLGTSAEPRPWAVVVNTGQANACTGSQGEADCRAGRALVAEALGFAPENVLPASTGVIGAHMDMSKWRAALPSLISSLGQTDLETFARAIMTTDAFPKLATREVKLGLGTVRLAGAAKGAGMICPDMATMISLILCDASIDGKLWQEMFEAGVNASFNRVSVDGDTSTNDTVLGLANGASGVSPLPEETPLLAGAVREILADLAYLLVRDGEGATKVVHIAVSGAASDADAERIARTVGHSQLVKTAMFGRDPNWGRIVAAAGRAGVDFRPEELKVMMCGVELFRNGQPSGLDFDALLREPLEQADITVDLFLESGSGSARLLVSDLTHDYVTINADYRS